MKLNFDDGSYCSFEHSNPGKVVISIGAKSPGNPFETTVNSAEIGYAELKSLVQSLQLESVINILETNKEKTQNISEKTGENNG